MFGSGAVSNEAEVHPVTVPAAACSQTQRNNKMYVQKDTYLVLEHTKNTVKGVSQKAY